MSHPLSGRVLDHRYEVREPPGGDPGASVLPAYDRMLQREVTLHLPGADAGEEARRRFHRDSRLAARVRHPNVLEIFDFVRVDGAEGVVTEPVEGRSLAARVAEKGPLAVPLAVEVARQAALGVAAGHGWGLVHGALEPGYVFIAGGEGGAPLRVRVLAVALAGGRGAADAFAAPEVAAGGAPSPASEVFSLASLAVFGVTGRAPEPGEAAQGLRLPGGGSAELEGVLSDALAPDPAVRGADAGAFAAALGAAPVAEGVPASRRRAWSGAAALVLVVLAAGGVILVVGDAMRGAAGPDSAPLFSGEPEVGPEVADATAGEGAAAHGEDGAARELFEVEVAPVPLNSDELSRQMARMYPPLLRDAGVSGLVYVRFRVDASGAVVAPSVQVVKSTHPQFADATRRAVRVLRFEPARARGEPVAVWVELPVQWMVSR